MLLIIEIFLTIWAWKRGWRWVALFPAGCALGIGFVIGLVLGASGETVESLGSGIIILDIIAIVILIFMIAKPKSKVAVNEEKAKSKKAREVEKKETD